MVVPGYFLEQSSAVESPRLEHGFFLPGQVGFEMVEQVPKCVGYT